MNHLATAYCFASTPYTLLRGSNRGAAAAALAAQVAAAYGAMR